MTAMATLVTSVLGPVSSATPGGGWGLFEAFFLLLCAWLVADWVRERKRRTGIRALASRRGFAYLGSSLPRSLNLRGTQLQETRSVWNVIDGDCGHMRVICFDCHIGGGRASWRRTVIAVKGRPDVFGSTLTADLSLEQCGEWSMMYEPKRMSLIPGRPMAVAEIEAHLTAIGNSVASQ
jgi:hypothetical protein